MGNFKGWISLLIVFNILNVLGQEKMKVNALQCEVKNVLFKTLLYGVAEKDLLNHKIYDYYFVNFDGNEELVKMKISGAYFYISEDLKKMKLFRTVVNGHVFLINKFPKFMEPLFNTKDGRTIEFNLELLDDSDLQLPLLFMGDYVYEIKSDLSFVNIYQ